MFDHGGKVRDDGARSDATPAVVPDDVDAWRTAAGVDVAGLDDDELIRALRTAEQVRRAMDAATAHLAAELDARGTTDRRDGLRTPAWLAWKLGLPKKATRATVRVGTFLRTHPDTDAALRDGRLSFDHVRALAHLCTDRVADAFDAIEPNLIDLAKDTAFDVWARDVRALLDLADADGGHDPRPEANRAGRAWGLDGDLHLALDLVGEAAIEADAHLEAETDDLFRRYRDDAAATDGELAVPDRQTLRALAALELFRKGRANGHQGSGPVADLTIVVTTPPDLSDVMRSPAPGQSDASWLEDLLTTTLDHLPLPRSTAALLCCDPTVSVLVEDFTGETLALGRTRRFASRAQRRAAARRYGGCCFPGCDAPPSWTDLHHTHHWDHGGTTDLELLAPLCRRHHGVVHREGWSMQPAPHGFDITTAEGRTLQCRSTRSPAPA